MSLHHDVPDGPVRKLVRTIVATDTPTSSSKWQEGWGGRTWRGPGGECLVVRKKDEPLRWRVEWEDVEGSHQAEFLARVTWERVK